MTHIKIEKAKQLEQNIGLFTNPTIDLLEMIWELQNEDGSKHQHSDELVQAVLNLAKSKQTILNILNES